VRMVVRSAMSVTSCAICFSLWLSLALSGSLWLSLALALSLGLSLSLSPGRCTFIGLGYCTGLLVERGKDSLSLSLSLSLFLSLSWSLYSYWSGLLHWTPDWLGPLHMQEVSYVYVSRHGCLIHVININSN
jgi:hypothetical protein